MHTPLKNIHILCVPVVLVCVSLDHVVEYDELVHPLGLLHVVFHMRQRPESHSNKNTFCNFQRRSVTVPTILYSLVQSIDLYDAHLDPPFGAVHLARSEVRRVAVLNIETYTYIWREICNRG